MTTIPTGYEAFAPLVERIMTLGSKNGLALIAEFREQSKAHPGATLEGDGVKFKVEDFLRWWDEWMANIDAQGTGT
jgi:hypothetical protein